MTKIKALLVIQRRDGLYLIYNSHLSDKWTPDIRLATRFGYPDESLLREGDRFVELG